MPPESPLGGVYPNSTRPPPRFIVGQPVGYPILALPPMYDQCRGHHPYLQDEEYIDLDDRFEELIRNPCVCALPYRYPWHTFPLNPQLPEVGHNCLPVVVHDREEAVEVLERASVVQGLDVGPKSSLRSGPSRLCSYLGSLPLWPPITHSCYMVATIQIVSWGKHIPAGIAHMGGVSLKQDHHSIPYFQLEKWSWIFPQFATLPWHPYARNASDQAIIVNETRYVLWGGWVGGGGGGISQ